MKLFCNKKAVDYGALMILVVAISVAYLSYSILVKSSEIETPIGSFATGIYNIATEAEKTIFYIEESAQLASEKAIYELANNGGFGETNCGKQGDYYLWNKDDEICTKNIEENYLWYFNRLGDNSWFQYRFYLCHYKKDFIS